MVGVYVLAAVLLARKVYKEVKFYLWFRPILKEEMEHCGEDFWKEVDEVMTEEYMRKHMKVYGGKGNV